MDEQIEETVSDSTGPETDPAGSPGWTPAGIWQDRTRDPSAPPQPTGRDFTEAHLAGIWHGGGGSPATPPPSRPHRRAWVLAAIVSVAVIAIGTTAAVVITRGESPRSRPRGVPSPGVSQRPVVLAPEDLAAEVEAFTVTLTWTQPAGGSPVDGYDIHRDGDVIATVEATETTYVDTGVVPGKSYSYGVASRVAAAASLPTSLPVETPVPPLKDARVEGLFNVKFKAVSQTGFQSYTGTFNRGWELKPKCDAGACDVRWNDVDEKSLKSTFVRTKDRYSGADSGDFLAVCGDSPVTSDLAIEFRVTKAGAIDGEWRATKLVGTVEETEEAQLGCLSSSATLSITANLLQ